MAIVGAFPARLEDSGMFIVTRSGSVSHDMVIDQLLSRRRLDDGMRYQVMGPLMQRYDRGETMHGLDPEVHPCRLSCVVTRISSSVESSA